MSTRGIIAVVDGDNILGVFHQYASYPSYLGNQLLLEVLRSGGELGVCIGRWIHDAPGGWLDLRGRQRAEETPHFFRLDDLELAGWVEWTYVFDERERCLHVWSGLPEIPGAVRGESHEGLRGTLEWSVRFDGEGRATPPFFPEDDSPTWHRVAVADDWRDDTEEQRRHRAAFRSIIRQRFSDEGRFGKEVQRALADGVERLNWTAETSAESELVRELCAEVGLSTQPVSPVDDDALCVRFFTDLGASVYWRVRVGAHELRFPAPACYRQACPLVFLRADGRSAFLDLEETLPEGVFATLVEAAAAAHKRGDWELQSGGLFRFRTVTDDGAANDRDFEIALSEARVLDPGCRVGDSLGTAEDWPPVEWLLLEWLRSLELGRG